MYKLLFLLSLIVVITLWVLEPVFMAIGSLISFLCMCVSASGAKIEGEISDY